MTLYKTFLYFNSIYTVGASPTISGVKKTASPSSTQQMNLRSTRVNKRGHTLPCLLMLCMASYDDMLLYRRVQLLDSDSGPNSC